MKLPIITEEQAIALAAQPQASYGQFAQVGAAGLALGETGQRGGSMLLEQGLAIEAKQRQMQEATEAMDIFSQVSKRATDLDLALKNDPNRDALTHVPRFSQGLKEIAQDELQKSQNPRVQQTANRLLQRYAIEAEHKARLDANAMFHDSERAATFQSLDQRKLEAVTATPAGREFYMGMALGFLQSKRGVFSDEEIAKLSKDFTGSVMVDAAKQAVDKDPFNADLTPFTGRMTLEQGDRVERYVEQRKRQALTDEDRAQTRLDREIGKQRTDTFSRLTDAILMGKGPNGGGVTEGMLRADPGWSFLEGGQREHLVTMLRNPKLEPSDPDTRTAVINRAFRDRPTIGIEELTRLNLAKKLNDADFMTAANHVNSRTDYWRGFSRSEQHRQEDQANTELQRRQGETERIMDTVLSVTGSLAERLDPKAQEVKGIAREAMLRRSKGFGAPKPELGMTRAEDPEAVMYDVLPSLMGQLSEGINEDYLKLNRAIQLTPYKTPDELLRAKGSIPTAKYDEYLKLFDYRREAKRQYDALQLQMQQKMAEAEARKKKEQERRAK